MTRPGHSCSAKKRASQSSGRCDRRTSWPEHPACTYPTISTCHYDKRRCGKFGGQLNDAHRGCSQHGSLCRQGPRACAGGKGDVLTDRQWLGCCRVGAVGGAVAVGPGSALLAVHTCSGACQEAGRGIGWRWQDASHLHSGTDSLSI